ncbi:hypothetical protein CN285_19500 [Bacillus cereus]|uniref:hypothetical protein n=1 Tax=Bacillus paramycoides TaxID=2026194 RepID=UPI000BFA771B|nr:hypothetical protein [Bacillus paramycoides]PFD38056.1 hypothetical protein CN285_19500 [Bacillus cereus]
MTQIIGDLTCPTINRAQLQFTNCLVFENCAQKIGEARIPETSLILTVLGTEIGALITAAAAALTPPLTIPAALLPGLILDVIAALSNSGNVAFDACVSSTPRLEGHLLRDKIINCGDVTASVTVRTTDALTVTLSVTIAGVTTSFMVTIPAGLMGCTLIALTIQEEEKACGVLPTDCIFEQVIDTEGSTTCVVSGTSVDPITGLVVITKLVIVKAAFVVLKKVVRAVQSPLPTCPPNGPCSPCS